MSLTTKPLPEKPNQLSLEDQETYWDEDQCEVDIYRWIADIDTADHGPQNFDQGTLPTDGNNTEDVKVESHPDSS